MNVCERKGGRAGPLGSGFVRAPGSLAGVQLPPRGATTSAGLRAVSGQSSPFEAAREGPRQTDFFPHRLSKAGRAGEPQAAVPGALQANSLAAGKAARPLGRWREWAGVGL